MRPRRGALGLRGRIVGAVLVTTVASLAVAALTLLGPLESKLRHADVVTFQSEVPDSTGSTFGSIQNLSDINALYISVPAPSPTPTTGSKLTRVEARSVAEHIASLTQLKQNAVQAHDELQREVDALATRVGATEVAVFGYPGAGGLNYQTVYRSGDSDIASADTRDDIPKAFRRGKATYSTSAIDGTEYLRAAIPFTSPNPSNGHPDHWVLAVRKQFAEVNTAAHAVRTAFIDAAIAGLVLTLLLAIPLSFRIVRRLRRLRQAAVELAEGGPHVEFRADRARDEVGDLARTFALMQLQLEQQEEARRAFVATASHELRTPLTSLEGMLELLEDDLDGLNPDLDDARALLARARVQSHRLGRLAADLLDLSRIDAQVDLRSEPVELGELSRAVLAEFELGTAERGVTPELRESGHPVWALGDPGSVARIIRILLDNAMRVSPRGSVVAVELHNGEHAALTVTDEGPGVPEAERELIFERFQRGRDTSGQAGFGLGLAIGRELAHRMGGELVLEERDTPGASFTLRLPVAAAPEPDALLVV